MNVYSVYDLKGECYEGLFAFVDDALAVRFFDSITFRQESRYLAYPEDFVLVSVGRFDDRSGSLAGCEGGHRMICSALDRKVFFEVQKKLFDEKVEKEISHA